MKARFPTRGQGAHALGHTAVNNSTATRKKRTGYSSPQGEVLTDNSPFTPQ